MTNGAVLTVRSAPPIASISLETFLLDPAGRLSGAIDPDANIDGKATDVSMRQALEQLLKPLGLAAVVKDEAVVITKVAKP